MSLSTIDIKYFKLAIGDDKIGTGTAVDIAVRCPVCGDSKHSKNKKRLHLYCKNGVTNVSCFNGDCPVHNKTVYSFLRDFYPGLLDSYRKENFRGTIEDFQTQRSSEVDVFKHLRVEKKEVVTQDLTPYMREITESEDALNYLRNRGIIYDEVKFGKWYFGHQDLKISEILYKVKNSIIIPLYYKGVTYGFYSRSIRDKFFCTYMSDLNPGFKVWNWFNIDKTQPVYIFEGIFDAISSGLKNIIALMGAKIPEERLKELRQPVFVLDNDRTGMENSFIYSKVAKVYIQPENFPEKDMNKMLLDHPEINIPELIKDNLYSGVLAQVILKSRF